MATVITEVSHGQSVSANLPARWILNISSDDMSGGEIVKVAESGKRHWIDRIVVTHYEKEWFQILDGDDVLVGPIVTQEAAPWGYDFRSPIACSEGADLKIQTQSDSVIHILLEGHTDAYPQLVYGPSPADGAVDVATDAVLSWSSAPGVTSYNVYINDAFIVTTATASHDPGGLDPASTYNWRVDIDGIPGNTWTFTTETG